MEIYVLNSSFEQIAIIDTFKSLLWVTRYFEPGDFELYVPADNQLLDILKFGYYLTREDDDTVMLIEKIEIQTDAENGNFFIVSGRSLESILDRRIIWEQTNVNAKACKATFTLLQKNVIEPSVSDRKISNFTIDTSSEDLVDSVLTQQFTGNGLLETIVNIAKQFGFGWRIKLVDKKFVYSCYLRDEVDVTFSPEFDNLINSNYQCDQKALKTIALIAGEGEGIARKTATYGTGSGLARRELYVDARDISSNGGEIQAAEYTELLQSRGKEKLSENVISQNFDGSIEPSTTYVYRKDYDVGNIVSIENEYGIVAKPRIVEIIESWDDNGYSVVPTFEKWEV